MSSSIDQRSAGIDLLRSLSVMIVIFSHYGILPEFSLPLGGTHGVVIFFMVSGYCMSYSLAGRNGHQFLAARFWRLVPILIICASITTLIEFLLNDIRPDRGQSFKSYGANIVCLPMGNLLCDLFFGLAKGESIRYSWVDGAYWSLLVEIRFYFLLWMLIYLVKIKSYIFVIASLGLFSIAEYELESISKSNDFLMYLPFFSFGMAVSDFLKGDKKGLLLMIYSFLVFFVLSYVEVDSISMNLNRANFGSYVFCFVVFLGFIGAFRKLSKSFIGYFGVLTYPLYLLHQDIGLIIMEIGFSSSVWINAAAAFMIVLFISIIVNSLIFKFQSKLKSAISDITNNYLAN